MADRFDLIGALARRGGSFLEALGGLVRRGGDDAAGTIRLGNVPHMPQRPPALGPGPASVFRMPPVSGQRQIFIAPGAAAQRPLSWAGPQARTLPPGVTEWRPTGARAWTGGTSAGTSAPRVFSGSPSAARAVDDVIAGADDVLGAAGVASKAAEAAKLPFLKRVGASFGKGGRGRKAMVGGGLLLGVQGVGSLFGANPIGGALNALRGGMPEEEQLNIEAALLGIPQAQTAGQTLEEQFNEWQSMNPYAGAATPDLMSAFQADAARQRATLEDYLASTGQYSRNQAQAIADAYQEMSKNLLETSGDVFQRGQVTAADIDRLYETMGTENLATAHGEGLSTPASDVGGLAAPSGAAATGADVARTYGGSLADYLGQQAGVESAALEQTAQSQALQGAALAQSLRDYVAMAEAEKRYQMGRELSAQERQIAQQQAMMRYEADLMAAEYQRQLAQQIFGFRATDRERAAAEEQVKIDSANSAAAIWISTPPDQRAILERLVGGRKGQEGLNAFVALAYQNPNILSALVG